MGSHDPSPSGGRTSFREGPAVVSDSHTPQSPIGMVEEAGHQENRQTPSVENVPYAGLRVDPNTVEGGQVEVSIC